MPIMNPSEVKRKIRFVLDLASQDRDHEAKLAFQELAFPDGLDQPPSPTVSDVMQTDDWESSTSVRLHLVTEDHCGGRVGKKGDETTDKVCHKAKTTCTASAHTESLVSVKEYGWRIACGSRSDSGVFRNPYLADDAVEGPISEAAKGRLLSPTKPFLLPAAHWKALFTLWLEASVATPESMGAAKDPSWDQKVSSQNQKDLTGNQKKPPTARPSVDSPEGGRYAQLFEGSKSKSKHVALFVDTIQEVSTELQPQPSGPSDEERERATQQDCVTEEDVYRIITTAIEEAEELVDHRISRLDDRLVDLESKLGEVANYFENKIKVVQSSGRRSGDSSLSHSELVNSVSKIKAQVDANSSVAELAMDTARDAQSSAQAASNAIGGVNARLRSGGGVQIDKLSFGSPGEVAVFCKANHVDIGCSADAFVLLNAGRSRVIHEEEFLKNRKGRSDTKIGTGIESIFLSSFDTMIPSSLSPSKESLGDLASVNQALKKLVKSYEIWEREDMSEGVKAAVEASAQECRTRVEEFAFRKSGVTADGWQFCQRLLTDSEKFVNQLLDFITRFYTQYHKVSGMSKDSLWDLCLEILAHILTEIARVRNAYVDAAASNPSLFYWGILKAWQVQQRYLGYKFVSDPALTGIFVRKALLRKNEHVVALEKKIEEMSVTIRQLTTQIANLKNKNNNKAKSG